MGENERVFDEGVAVRAPCVVSLLLCCSPVWLWLKGSGVVYTL
jgi:hypothetical protein